MYEIDLLLYSPDNIMFELIFVIIFCIFWLVSASLDVNGEIELRHGSVAHLESVAEQHNFIGRYVVVYIIQTLF
jgi:hypothetical protein